MAAARASSKINGSGGVAASAGSTHRHQRVMQRRIEGVMAWQRHQAAPLGIKAAGIIKRHHRATHHHAYHRVAWRGIAS